MLVNDPQLNCESPALAPLVVNQAEWCCEDGDIYEKEVTVTSRNIN